MPGEAGLPSVVYYCRTYVKAVRGRRVKRGDVCYGMLRAAASVDESDHHALMYVWHGQTPPRLFMGATLAHGCTPRKFSGKSGGFSDFSYLMSAESCGF